MTSKEAYKKFELKFNNANTSSSIDFSVGEFVLLFNDQQMIWTLGRVEGRGKLYEINDIQFLIEPETPLTGRTEQDRYTSFDLPTDYINYISSYSLATKGGCSGRVVYSNQVKLNDIDLRLRDEFTKPSFEYHETPVTVSKDQVQIYTDDFTVDKLYLTYYRYPKSIDLVGYTRLDGTASTTIDPELYDQAADEVINLCVLEAQRIASNTEGFQLSVNRVNNN